MTKSVAFSLLLSSLLFAAEEDLTQILEETTEIATKTRLNADYVPGTVSIISGESLKALGILNLNQPNALDMIVGMDSSVNALRGSGTMYGGQGIKIKWMLNGRAISSQLWSGSTWGRGVISFPILTDQIDRIEIIRGPDSAIYGDNAIFGVINIITKNKNNNISVSATHQGDDKYGENVALNINTEKDDLKINSSLSFYKTDGYAFNIGTTGNYYNSVDAKHTPGSYGPGDLQNNSLGYNAILDASYNDYKIWFNHLETKSAQGAFGTWYPTDPLPQNDGKLKKKDSYQQFGVERDFYSGDSFSSVKVGLDTSESTISDLLRYTPDFGLSTVDVYRSYRYKEQRKYASADFSDKFGAHRVSLGATVQETKNVIDERTQNIVSVTPPSVTYPANTGRQQEAFFFQDSWDVADSTTVVYGARYDKFHGDIKSNGWSPRIALVYRANESNILKAQYARAFRPPSFGEMAGASNIKSETVDTVELGHIYKGEKFTFKNTLFESRIYDMITYDDFTYDTVNLPNVGQIRGLEMEAKYSADLYEVAFNQAFYNTHRGDRVLVANTNDYTYKGGEFPLSPSYMANLILKVNQNTSYPTTFWYHYIGSKKRKSEFTVANNDNAKGGSNGSVAPQDYLNITQQFKNVFKDTDLSMGIQNVFGKTMKTLYMPLTQPNDQDIPYMRQMFWMNISYKF